MKQNHRQPPPPAPGKSPWLAFSGKTRLVWTTLALMALCLALGGNAWATAIHQSTDITSDITWHDHSVGVDYVIDGNIQVGQDGVSGSVTLTVGSGVTVQVAEGFTLQVGDSDPDDVSTINVLQDAVFYFETNSKLLVGDSMGPEINRMVINKGCEFKFEIGASLVVGDEENADETTPPNGSLKAIGEKNHEIVFTEAVEDEGWDGIHFTPQTDDSQVPLYNLSSFLMHCEVSKAGSFEPPYDRKGANITIDSCNVGVINSEITNGKNTGIHIKGDCEPVITGFGGDRGIVADNAGYGILCNGFVGDKNEKHYPSPYIVGNDFERNGIGETDPSTENGKDPAALFCYPLLTGAMIQDKDYVLPGLALPGPYIHDNIFKENRFNVIQLAVQDIESNARWVNPNPQPCTDPGECVNYEVTVNRSPNSEIRIQNVPPQEDLNNLPPAPTDTAWLTVDPGTTVIFDSRITVEPHVSLHVGHLQRDGESYNMIRGPGGLNAVGTPDQKITFRGLNTDSWAGITFRQEDALATGTRYDDIDESSTLKYCTIQDALVAAIKIDSCDINVECNEIEYNNQGIWLTRGEVGGQSEIKCNDFRNNTQFDISTDSGVDLRINHNNFFYKPTSNGEPPRPSILCSSYYYPLSDATRNYWEYGVPHVSEYIDDLYPLLAVPNTSCDPILWPDAVVYGEKPGYLAGYTAFATGDVNGDTIDDLILAAPGAEAAAGEVYVYLGREDWPDTNDEEIDILDIAGIDGLPQTPDIRILGQCPNDNLGAFYGVASGDLNADGADDIVLSAHWGRDCNTSDADGKVFVIYGKKDGTWAVGGNLTLDLANNGADVAIYGPNTNAGLGKDLVLLADVDNNGKKDLVVGAPRAWHPTLKVPPSDPFGSERDAVTGAAYIFKGESLSQGRLIDLAVDPKDPLYEENIADITIYGKQDGDSLGKGGLLAVGNFDGSGSPDLAVGAYFAKDIDNHEVEGEVYLLYDIANTSGTVDLNSPPPGLTIRTIQGGGDFKNPGQSGRMLVADMNNDSLDDLILGVPRLEYTQIELLDPSIPKNPGACLVVLGGMSVPTITMTGFGGLPTGVVAIKGLENQPLLTANGAMDVGDVDGDGSLDLLLGDRSGRGGDGNKPLAGQAFLILNPPMTSGTLIDLAAPGGVTVFSVHGAATDDRLGGSSFAEAALVKLLDMDNDGLDDVVLGASQNDGANGLTPNAGAIYLFYSGEGLSGTVDLASQTADKAIYGPHENAMMGVSGVFGQANFNGDDYDDLFWGAPLSDVLGASSGERDEAGEVFLRFGTQTLIPYTPPVNASVAHMDPAGDATAFDYDTTRVTIDYDSGKDESLTVVSLNAGVEGLDVDPAVTADVNWQIETDRKNFDATVTFQYLDSEVEGLDESRLALFSAKDATKKFKPVKNASLDPATNTVTVTGVKKFSFFVIMENPKPKKK